MKQLFSTFIALGFIAFGSLTIAHSEESDQELDFRARTFFASSVDRADQISIRRIWVRGNSWGLTTVCALKGFAIKDATFECESSLELDGIRQYPEFSMEFHFRPDDVERAQTLYLDTLAAWIDSYNLDKDGVILVKGKDWRVRIEDVKRRIQRTIKKGVGG